jgi:hypothetical protein
MIRPRRGKCSAQALQLADRRAAGAVAACAPPSHRCASCNAGASPTIQRSRRDRDNEAVLSRAVHPGCGLVVQSGARSLRHRDAIISHAARYKLPAYSAGDCADIDPAERGRVDRIGKPQCKKTGSPTAAMGQTTGSFDDIRAMSGLPSTAVVERTSMDGREVPGADIGSYSITLSASSCSELGTARPRAAAVLRLMTSSYLNGS